MRSELTEEEYRIEYISLNSLKQGESCSSPFSPGGIPKDKHFSTEHLYNKNGINLIYILDRRVGGDYRPLSGFV